MKTVIISLVLIILALIATPNWAAPDEAALVDTGYDLCRELGERACDDNHNLLFRGSYPLPYNEELFREKVMTYLQAFKKAYQSQAHLPDGKAALSNYRIVMINLINGDNVKNKAQESAALLQEFKTAQYSLTETLPKQHVMYGLDNVFSAKPYAFEWWPMTLHNFRVNDDKKAMSLKLNWSKEARDQEALTYLPLNLPYLVTGKNLFSSQENKDARSIAELLKTIPKDGHPLLIFYHCLAGKDRTGVVTMSYFMSYGGYPYLHPSLHVEAIQKRNDKMSFKEAQQNASKPGLIPNHRALKLTQAFCIVTKEDKTECEPIASFKSELSKLWDHLIHFHWTTN